jgi:hypothetical protein
MLAPSGDFGVEPATPRRGFSLQPDAFPSPGTLPWRKISAIWQGIMLIPVRDRASHAPWQLSHMRLRAGEVFLLLLKFVLQAAEWQSLGRGISRI